MDINVFEQSGIAYQEGLDRFSGIKEIYEKYLRKFLNDPEFTKLQESLDAEDYDAAFKYAHALKGITGNLSLNCLYKCIVPLVEALRNGELDNIEELRASVEQEYKLTCNALRQAGC